jgi:hypothetical protein
MLTIDSLPDWFRKTPAGKAALAEEQDAVLDDRRRHGAIIAAAERERDEKLPGFDKRLAAAAAIEEKARKDYEAAQFGTRALDADRTNFLHEVEYRIGRAAVALAATAPPCIEAARTEVMARMERSREDGVVFEAETLGVNALSRAPVTRILATNRHTISAWQIAAVQALHKLERLAGTYVSDYDLACERILNELGERPAVEPPVTA